MSTWAHGPVLGHIAQYLGTWVLGTWTIERCSQTLGKTWQVIDMTIMQWQFYL
jgi:hypothetical protein